MKFLLGILVGVLLTLQVGVAAETSESLRSRVRRLEQKTKALNTYGDLKYDHIIVPTVCDGATAEWTGNEDGLYC